MEEIIHVACPCCKNKRLFDLVPGATGIIQIKCPICRGVVAVSLHNYEQTNRKGFILSKSVHSI